MTDRLQTARLVVRPMTVEDLDLVVDLNSDAVVMKFITGRGLTPAESEEEVRNALGSRWLVFESSADRFLGWVGAVPTVNSGEYDIGWRFCRSAWGKGYATEAAGVLVAHLFAARQAQRVFAETMAVNDPSRAVMQRLGLRYVRTFHLEFDEPLPGTELGEVEYELTREDWLQQDR